MPQLIYFAFTAACASWVAYDGSKLGVERRRLGGGAFDMGPVGWFFAVFLLWIIAFPGYLWVRPRYVALQGRSQQMYGTPAPTPPSPYGQGFAVPMRPVPVAAVTPPWESAAAPTSPDGHWWWDGRTWQPTGQ